MRGIRKVTTHAVQDECLVQVVKVLYVYIESIKESLAIAHTTDLTACQKLYLFTAGITFGSEDRSYPIMLRLTVPCSQDCE